MNGYCLGCRAEMPLVLVGYALSGKGVVLGAYVCPAGHRVSRTLPLDPPPDDLEGRRTYAMGAAAGYAAGVAREGGKLARAFPGTPFPGHAPGGVAHNVGGLQAHSPADAERGASGARHRELRGRRRPPGGAGQAAGEHSWLKYKKVTNQNLRGGVRLPAG